MLTQRIKRLMTMRVAQQLKMKEWLDYLAKFTTPNNYCCFHCNAPVGMKGTPPAIQIGDRRNKKYKHINCGG